MTYLDMYMLESDKINPKGCPYHYGYEPSPVATNGCIHKAAKRKGGCEWCWNREMSDYKPGDVVASECNFHGCPAVVIETGSGTGGSVVLVYYKNGGCHDGNGYSINAENYDEANYYYLCDDEIVRDDTPMEEIISKEKLHELLMLGVE